MNLTRAEYSLAWLYIASILLSTTSLILFIVVHQNWMWTFDVCLNSNNLCRNCILYGVNTFSTFVGGNSRFCQFSSYGLVPGVAIGLAFGIYHVHRNCIREKLDNPKLTTYTSDGISKRIVIVGRKRTPSCKLWIPATFSTIIIFSLSFVHAIIITDGYLKTCYEYRKHLITLLGSRGNEAKVIHDKLSCGSIFNFMDYLHPDDNNWQRGRYIDTGLLLQLSIISTWFNSLTWITATFINFILARKKYL